MATVKDILPIPENPGIVTDPEHHETSQTLADEPTISHSLAVANHDEKGHAQVAHDGEVADLGWHEPDNKIPDPLVGGLPNDDLWILIRRFNKVMQWCVVAEDSILTHHSNCIMSRRCRALRPEAWISTSPTKRSSHLTSSEHPSNDYT